jgi:hypothetical protein
VCVCVCVCVLGRGEHDCQRVLSGRSSGGCVLTLTILVAASSALTTHPSAAELGYAAGARVAIGRDETASGGTVGGGRIWFISLGSSEMY